MESLRKEPTGIKGLDEILDGGLPKGRPTLVCGGPGCGKTLLSIEFICRGAGQFAEPGLIVSFEETREDIETNFAQCSFGFTEALADQTVRIESVPLERNYSVETGAFTLDGLLVRLERWIQAIGAKRLVLDSLHSLFEHFSDTAHLRFEYARIFRWIKEKNITAIITSERSQSEYTLHGQEEYLSECVIYMDHRIANQISKRRLRVVKYRGSSHGTDEYPFLISTSGISLLPITSLEFGTRVSTELVTTGIKGLDDMFAGKGWYRGSTVLISGGPGTGKSTLAAAYAKWTCKNGGRSLLLSFEESGGQIVRNMRSVGLHLDEFIEKGSMQIEPIRPGRFGLEEHLVRVHTIIDTFQPETVILDPITSFSSIGGHQEIHSMLTRLLDYIKLKGINTLLTSLTSARRIEEESGAEVSSIVDTWIILRFQQFNGERRRQILVHKARGIDHSHTIGELLFSSSGIVVQPFAGLPQEDGDGSLSTRNNQ
jgi:circadian clock protein KaiC